MSLKDWEERITAEPGAAARIAEIEDELRLANGLTALREKAGLSQRELAARVGVSQPRVAAIERSKNVTIEMLRKYVRALDADLVITVVRNGVETPLVIQVKERTKRAAKTTAAVGKKGVQAAPARLRAAGAKAVTASAAKKTGSSSGGTDTRSRAKVTR